MQSNNLTDLVARMAAFGTTVETMPETGKIDARQALAIASEATAIMQLIIDKHNQEVATADKMRAICNKLRDQNMTLITARVWDHIYPGTA